MKRKMFVAAVVMIAVLVFAVISYAGRPEEARYTDDDTKIFWFVQISDTHIGDSSSQDTTNLDWMTGPAFDVILPEFMVVTGDLTDSTNGGPIIDGPYQAEWDSYRSILTSNGMNEEVYYDLPGNHDQYSDGDLSYYRANSIQGAATGQTQHSWTRTFDFGTYHFVGVATCGNDGWPWPFDNSGLDSDELTFIENELSANADADLTFLFGHHPTAWWLYGRNDFIDLTQSYGASVYAYGHTHFFDAFWSYDVLRFNIGSLGEGDDHHFAVFAVDNNGLAVNWSNVDDWPLVVITAPLDSRLGSDNPYAYPVSADYDANPIRALVFDSAAVSLTEFKVGNGVWSPMTYAGDMIWEGEFDARNLPTGETRLEVRATGSRTHSQVIYFNLETTACYDGIDNDGDLIVDWPDDPGCYSPSDTDESNPNHAPVAEAGEEITVALAETAFLDGSGSSDPDNQPLTYSWDFDNSDGIGEDATGEQAQNVYYLPGDYVVTLTVEDPFGLSDIDTTTVHVTGGDDDSDDDTDDDIADDSADDADDDWDHDDTADDSADDTGDDTGPPSNGGDDDDAGGGCCG